MLQFAGHFCGALVSWMMTKDPGHLGVANEWIFAALVEEMFGAFFFILTFLIQTEKNTVFSTDRGIRALVIAACYSVIVEYTKTPAGGSVNPAYGLAVCFTMLFGGDGGNGLSYVWIYIIFPLVGSVLALIGYEFMWKRAMEGGDNK
jgi:glycerol uptake facilitator-like aquaporin